MKALLCSLLLLVGFTHGESQTLTGTIVDERNAPVRDAAIATVSGTTVFQETRSDERGSFTIVVNAQNDLRLRVTKAGFGVFERRLAEIASPVTVVLSPAALRESITVSIMRTGTRLEETPATVVVIDRDTLETSAAQNLDDVLRQVPGFTLFRRSSSRTTNPTAQGANLRGVGGSGAARTSVQFDGVSLNDAFGGWTYWSKIPQIAVERVEVLRGGASSLFGSSALSGAIELNSPRERRNAFRFAGSGGSQRTLDGGLFGSAARGRWYGDIAIESFQTAGYIPTAPENRGAVDTRANSRFNSGFVTVERRLGDDARVYARGHLFSERRDNGTSLTNNRTYFRQAVAGSDISNSRTGAFQFRVAVDAQVYDQTFSAVAADRNSESLTRIQRVPSRSARASAFWTRVFGDHSITAQADTRYVRGFSQEVAVNNGLANAHVTAGGKETAFGILAQDFWRVTSRLNVSIGGRFDSWTEYGGLSRTRSLVTNQTVETFFPERTEHSFSPRASAIYRVSSAVSLFGSYSHSFRAPSLNELYRSFRVGNVLTLANEALRAERARTLEAGVNLAGYSRRVVVRANVFRTKVEDPVVSVTLTTTPTLITRRRENVGETRSLGLEADAELLVSEKVRLTFGYLLTDSKIVDAGANDVLVGKQLPQIARQHFTSQVVYKPARAVTLSIQARASDAQFDDDLNTFRLRPFFTIDAYAGYRFRKWVELFAAAENLFDRRYDIGLTPVRTISAPRFIRLGFRFDLNRRD